MFMKPLMKHFMKLLNSYLSAIYTLRVQAGMRLSMTSNENRNLLLRTLLPTLLGSFIIAMDKLILNTLISTFPRTFNAILELLASLLLLTPMLYILYLLAKAHARAKRIEEEMKYFIISESIIASASPNIIDDLTSLGNLHEIFNQLSRESVLLRRLRRLMTTSEVVHLYSKWVKSKFVGNLLGDFVFAQSLGIVRAWLREKGGELLEELKVDSLNRVKLRATVSVLFAVLLGYVPPIILALSALMGGEVVTKALTMTLMLCPTFFLVTPRTPKHFEILFKKLPRKCLVAAATIITILIFKCATVMLEQGGETHMLLPYLIPLGITLTALGLFQVSSIINAVYEARQLSNVLLTIIEAPLSVGNALAIVKEALRRTNYRVFKELSSRVNLLSAYHGALSNARLWITKFTMYTIMKGLMYGTLNKENLMKLRNLVTEMLREFKLSLSSNAIVAMLALALPLILNYVGTLGSASVTSLTTLYIIASSLIYSSYASYVIFGKVTNTLLPGAVCIELALLLR